MSDLIDNEYIANQFKKLAKLRSSLKDPTQKYRIISYLRAVDTILDFPERITSSSDLKNTPGIGPSIKSKIDEIIKNGVITELKNKGGLEEKSLEEVIDVVKGKTSSKSTLSSSSEDVITLFTGILDVGKETAKAWYNRGFRTLDDLNQAISDRKLTLNHGQQVGLKYYNDLQQRIPRSEMDKYNDKIQAIIACLNKHMNIKMKVEMAGSYRRLLKSSGDIDLVFTVENKKVNIRDCINLFILVLKFMKLIVDDVHFGDNKYLGVVRYYDNKPLLSEQMSYLVRHIDIEVCEPDVYPFALLYFTGSKNFNTRMRGFAKSKGLSLNQKGLYIGDAKKGVKVDKLFLSEKDIFDYLQFPYLEPDKRNS